MTEMTKIKNLSPRNSQVTFETLQALISVPSITALEKRSTLRISDFKGSISNNGALEEEEKIILRRPQSRNLRALEKQYLGLQRAAVVVLKGVRI